MTDRAIQHKIVESALDLVRDMGDRKMIGMVMYEHCIEDTWSVSLSSTKDFIIWLKALVEKEEMDLIVREAINGMKADKNGVPIFYKSTKEFSWGDGVETNVGLFMLTRNKKNVEEKWRCPMCNHWTTGYGNNPEPLMTGVKVCDDCNKRVVLARMKYMDGK